jgi:hypothetical protein
MHVVKLCAECSQFDGIHSGQSPVHHMVCQGALHPFSTVFNECVEENLEVPNCFVIGFLSLRYKIKILLLCKYSDVQISC